MDLPTLVDRSQTAVVGTVTGKRSRWEENGGMIYTYVRVRIEQVVAGAVGPRVITIKCPGGTVGNITCTVPDAPTWTVGERMVLFLRSQFFNVVGWRQGKKTIRDGRLVGERMTLDAFLGRVRAVAARQGRRVPAQGRLREPERKPVVLRRPGGPRRQLKQPPRILRVEPLAEQVLMSDGFEGAWPGAWALYGIPTWGTDDYRPHTGTYSAWCAKSGAGLDPEFHNYANDMDAWMAYGPFDLSTWHTACLRFWAWVDAQSGYDYFAYAASTDDVDYYGYTVSGGWSFWYDYELDLTEYRGDPDVWIAFIFYSNSTVTDRGAFVDDVSITVDTGPAIDEITPEEESAGTDAPVTIQGEYFGATQKQSDVQFYYKAGEPKTVADVVSWSDTEIVCTVPRQTSSGPVTVVTSKGTSNEHPFWVTFSYSGARWHEDALPVPYEIYENAADCTGEGMAIQAAANEWNAWTSGTNFSFYHAGSTDLYVPAQDGHNVLRWNADLGGPIGLAWRWSATSTEGTFIYECDVAFAENYDWSTGSYTPAGCYDVQTIALHEMGHWLALGDLYGWDWDKVMCGYGLTDQQKRSLHYGDKLGLNWVYAEPTIASLSSLSAALVGRIGALVEFDWLDPREVVGFELYRRSPAMPAFERTRTLWSEPNRQHYRILDPGGRPGMMYQVRSIYPDGRRQRHGSIVARPAF